MNILFATTNSNKIASAQNVLQKYGITVEGVHIEVDEIQESDHQKVMEDKLKKAYAIVNKPLMSMDSGFFIEELKGFPGVITKYALETIGEQGLVNLCKPLKNKTAYIQRFIGLTDGETYKYFSSRGYGEVVSEITASNGYGYEKILNIPGKGILGDLSFEEQINFVGDAWDQLGLWLSSEYKKNG